MKKASISLVAVSFMLLLVTGCATVSENRLHVAVADIDEDNPSLKFYRITIRASAINKDANLHTGFFDAKMLRDYLGEVPMVSQSVAPAPIAAQQSNVVNNLRGATAISDGAPAVVPGGDTAPVAAGKAQNMVFIRDGNGKTWRPVDPNYLFTIVCGTDVKALVAAINSYSDNQVAGKLLGRMAARVAAGDASETAEVSEKAASAAMVSTQELAQQLRSVASEVNKLKADDNATPEQVLRIILEAARASAQTLKQPDNFFVGPAANGFDLAEQVYEKLRNMK